MSQGTVRVMSLDKPVLLVGREAMNRSVDGDVVVVEIFPKSEWKAPGSEVLDQDRELMRHQMQSDIRCKADESVALKDDDADDDEDAGIAEGEKKDAAEEKMDVDTETKKKPHDVLPTGKVVGIIKRNWRA